MRTTFSLRRPSRRAARRILAGVFALGPGLLLAAAAAGPVAAAGPITSPACTAAGTIVTCNLWAKTGTLGLPTGGTVPVWGFATSAGGAAEVPGPVLVVTEGDSVTVNLTNSLGVSTALDLGGTTLVPDLAGIAPGGSTAYTFTAGTPGTYTYGAGLMPGTAYQAALGMTGALVVRPAGAPGQAYAAASTAFTDEALAVFAEIDPALNNAASPAAYDLRTFAPTWFVLNGAAYPNGTDITTTPGGSLLVRYVNAGLRPHSIGVLGLHQAVLGVDGNALPYPRRMVAETIGAGQTLDALLAIPATPTTPAKYPLYDASALTPNNGAGGFGGIVGLISASGTPASGDTTGPTASGLTVTLAIPNATVAASVSDLAAGGSDVVAAELAVDSKAAAPLAMTGTFGPSPVAVSATFDTSALASGTHTVFVRGQDAAGNWGPWAATSFILDKAGPAISGAAVSPAITNSSAVTLSATASDSANGGSNVTAAEYFIDAAGAPGTGTAMNLATANAVVSSATATLPAATIGALTEGAHTIFIDALDAAGNWGVAGTVTLAIDRTGPVASGATANPNPTNAKTGINSTNPSVRVTASFADAAGIVSTGELFVDAAGANGSGIPFVPADGIFNGANESGFADIPLTTINALSQGNHTILVHGKDSAGNWGATASVTLLVDKTAPTLAATVTTSPVPLNTTTSPYTNNLAFTLNGTATDTATNVTGGEWWEGTDPGQGKGNAFTAPVPALSISTLGSVDFVTRAMTPGVHTLNVRVRDAAGNWSAVRTATVTIIYPDPLFTDGFESGNTTAWASATGGTRLTVTAGAAAPTGGAFGMQTQINGNQPTYVTDTRPLAERQYHARFSFNPRSFTTGTNGNVVILSGLTGGNGFVFRVQYRRTAAGAHQVRLLVNRAGGTTATAYVTIANNAFHSIEIAWASAGAASASLRVDGAAPLTLNGLNTSALALESVRLGPSAGLAAGFVGTPYFDRFESHRYSAVGP